MVRIPSSVKIVPAWASGAVIIMNEDVCGAVSVVLVQGLQPSLPSNRLCSADSASASPGKKWDACLASRGSRPHSLAPLHSPLPWRAAGMRGLPARCTAAEVQARRMAGGGGIEPPTLATHCLIQGQWPLASGRGAYWHPCHHDKSPASSNNTSSRPMDYGLLSLKWFDVILGVSCIS